MTIECPRCYLRRQSNGTAPARWRATGRFVSHRRGVRCAELRCEDCGQVFTSGQRAAIDAAEAIALPPETPGAAPGAAPQQPTIVRPVPRPVPFAAARDLVQEFRRKQAGDV